MCVAELVLRGLRPAPDNGATVRTRRGRASLAGLGGQGSQSSQAGTSINGSTTMRARKTTQSHKPALTKRPLQDSDSELDGMPLRESNLMSHTSMNNLRQAATEATGTQRSARPPLIPPSQQVRRGALPAPERALLINPRPIKRTRFENIQGSSSDSSKARAAVPATSTEQQAGQRPVPGASGSVGLAGILDRQAVELLASLGYHTVADLSGIGVSREDWPDLSAFLASCTLEQSENTPRRAEGRLDPLQTFLLHSEHNSRRFLYQCVIADPFTTFRRASWNSFY